MAKKRQIKPTGKIHPVEFTDGSFKIAKNKFVFPEAKADIENKIANYFLKVAAKYNKYPFPERMKLISNKENDLDFSLKSKNFEYLLELTEITPPGQMKGGYKELSTRVNSGDHAAKIIELILKKSKKYIGIKSKIALLMYATDFRSAPSPHTQTLVMDFLNKVPLNFVMIFEIIPSLEDDGFYKQYYPNTNLKLAEKRVEMLKRTPSVIFKPDL